MQADSRTHRNMRRVAALVAAGLLLAPAATASSVPDGTKIGTLSIPKLGVRTSILQGTSAAQLAGGVGHYKITAIPGQGKVVAIAGHRTTYHRPFRHLDALRAGDRITITMWYGKQYRYVVTGTRIVAFNDWSILKGWGAEKLVLSACHPPGSASYRIVAFAKRA